MDEYIRLKDVMEKWPKSRDEKCYKDAEAGVVASEFNYGILKCFEALNSAEKVRVLDREELVNLASTVSQNNCSDVTSRRQICLGCLADAILKAQEEDK